MDARKEASFLALAILSAGTITPERSTKNSAMIFTQEKVTAESGSKNSAMRRFSTCQRGG
jgi:hypothetical protein